MARESTSLPCLQLLNNFKGSNKKTSAGVIDLRSFERNKGRVRREGQESPGDYISVSKYVSAKYNRQKGCQPQLNNYKSKSKVVNPPARFLRSFLDVNSLDLISHFSFRKSVLKINAR